MGTTGIPEEPRDFDRWTVSQDQRVEGAHGRREFRQIWVLPVSQLGGLYQQEQWAGLQSVVMVYRRRQMDNGKVTVETQFFLSS